MTPGTDIGSYRVLTRIGAGGMGEVWLAEHVALGRRAAIKVLHAELSTRADAVTRFFNEARAATAISDPGIVQIFDFGQHHDGSAYIVMELLEGEPLDRRLARLGSLALPDALRIMRQVSTSLGAAHARGIIHRDLKPENIFLVPDAEVGGGERPKILDFGIAKLTGTQMSAHLKTRTASILGTPTYMSPEQCRGTGQIDGRSDVYALGCVLFQLVTGRPPFDAEGLGEIIAKHLYEAPPLASSCAPGIPHAVDELLARCLAKEPDRRFESALELAAALARIHPTGAPGATLPPPSPRPSGAALIPTTLSVSVAVTAMPTTRRHRAWWMSGVGLAAALVTAAVVTVARAPSEPAAARTPTPIPAPVVSAPDVIQPSQPLHLDKLRAALSGVDATGHLHAAFDHLRAWARVAPAPTSTPTHLSPPTPAAPAPVSPCGDDIPSCK